MAAHLFQQGPKGDPGDKGDQGDPGVAGANGSVGPIRPGAWYRPPGTLTSASALSNNGLYLVPWWFKGTLDRLVFEAITTPGSAGATCNGVCYADDGNGYPGALVLDTGPIAVDVLGIKGDTTPVGPFTGDGLYWWGVYIANAVTTRPQMRGLSVLTHSFLPNVAVAQAMQQNCIGLFAVGVAGGPPNPAPAGLAPLNGSPPSWTIRGA